MSLNYICSGQKFIVGGSENETIALPLPLFDIPEGVTIKGTKLVKKTTYYHISLVCIGEIISRHNVSIPNFIEKVTQDFCDYIKSHDVSLLHYRDEFRYVKEDDLETVVVMCDISKLDRFFDVLNKKYKNHLSICICVYGYYICKCIINGLARACTRCVHTTVMLH